MIRVAQMTLSMGQGGIENLIVAMTRMPNTSIVETHLYCLDSGGELLDSIENKGVPYRVFNRKPGFDLSVIWRLTRALKSDRIQILHTHNQAAHFYGCLAALLARVPVIINTEHSRHNIDLLWRRRVEKKILSFFSDLMTTVSDELRELAIIKDGISARKVYVVSNGIDVPRFSSIGATKAASVRLSLGIPKEAKVVSIVARLHPVKNHQLLFSAIRLASKQIDNLYLLVVGDGDCRAELEELVNTLEMTDRIFFLGNRKDVPEIMKASDLMTLCSFSEGLPLVLLEAMASGTPVIVTEGANRSGLVRNGINGFVSPSDPRALANCFSMALSDQSTYHIIAMRARDEVERNFSIVQTILQYEELYHKLLSSKLKYS